MQVKCFECSVTVEAADADALEDAFVLHGQTVHQWSYPEQAVRNYARNFAEAVERLTGPTERRDEIGPIVVLPVTADRIGDWLDFFDHDGFAGNPDWASCYCLYPHSPPPPEMPERAWRQSRAMVVERLRGGGTHGYLAYVDGRPAGWVNASLRASYELFAGVDPGGPDPAQVIGVSCFVVAPPYRRHGVASALLDRVIADAAARGAAFVEAYPHSAPDQNDAGHFRGPRSMYEARGFQQVEVRENFALQRLAVAR
jgi:GNAT superfamily N-acetyltransferase